MGFSFSSLHYRQQNLLAEICFLFIVCVLSPFLVGLQIFSHFSHTLSLVLMNMLDVPVIMLFYRVYLPYTVGKRKYFLALLLLPVYILVYELNGRLEAMAVIRMPFIPLGYRNALASGHPEDFTKGYFNQSIGYTCLVLLAGTSLYVVKLLFKNRHNLAELATEKLRLELNHLKSQVQPHFFFNTLNNMYALSVQGSPKTPQMITNLSAIMRYVLYDASHEKVSLQQEVAFIRSYIQLENLRHTQPDIIDFSVQGDVSRFSIEPLLFLPLVENTFKHALHTTMPEKWVKLVLAVDEDELIFQTTNAVNPDRNIHHQAPGGIGLMNVRKRLELLYPGRNELIVHDEPNSFTVTLMIAYKKGND